MPNRPKQKPKAAKCPVCGLEMTPQRGLDAVPKHAARLCP